MMGRAGAALAAIVLCLLVPAVASAGSAPQGSWIGTYGHEGYDLAAWDGSSDVSYIPGASVSVVRGSRYEWASSTEDARALESPDGLTREAATYYDPNEVKLDIYFTSAYTGDLHLYAVDWDSSARREAITVNDEAETENPAGAQTTALSSEFNQGAWTSFPISVPARGTVSIVVKRTAGANAVLSGIFLGETGPPPAMSLSSSPQGTWSGAVGSQGYDLAGWDGSSDVSHMPEWASLSLTQGSRYEWASSTQDPRALQSPEGLTRAAATYYDPNQLRLSLKFHSAYTGTLHLYALDWDSTARRELISVNGQTAALSSSFNEGAWLSFPISLTSPGSVSIVVDHTAGANAVLSGIFLGEAGSPPGMPTSSAPQGTWTGAVGSAGYDLAAWDGSSDLSQISPASLSLAQGSRWVWASSTEDPRALQSPDGLTREAATYYDPHQIRLSLEFNSSYSGDLHLYAVDWDSSARRELISVDGETAELSSSFNQGAWVTFPISVAAGETVSILVDRTAGANAVLSGIFLGDASATNVTAGSAQLNASGQIGSGSAATVSFQYATSSVGLGTPSATHTQAQGPYPAGGGFSITQTITGLQPATTYYYEACTTPTESGSESCGPVRQLSTYSAGGWQHYGNDAGHSGYNPEEQTIDPSNVGDLTNAWSANPAVAEADPQLTISAGPIVSDGIAYIAVRNGWDMTITNQSTLYAYAVGCATNAESCSPLWKAAVPDGEANAIAAEDGMVFVSRNGYPGPAAVYAFAADCATGGATCSPLWTASSSTTDSALPLDVSGGFVFWGSDAFLATCATGGATCQPLGTLTVPGLPSPEARLEQTAVAAGEVYVSAEVPRTGSNGGVIHARELLAYQESCVTSATACGPTWIATLPNTEGSPARLAVAGGNVYVTYWSGTQDVVAAYGTSCGTGGATCTPTWTAQVPEYSVYAPYIREAGIANGVVYVATNKLYAFGASCASSGATCSPLWTAPLPSAPSIGEAGAPSSPSIANGVAYLVASAANGVQLEVLAFPDSCGSGGATCAPLWSVGLGNLPRATGLFPMAPAIADGSLFVGTFQSDGGPQDRFDMDSELDAFEISP